MSARFWARHWWKAVILPRHAQTCPWSVCTTSLLFVFTSFTLMIIHCHSFTITRTFKDIPIFPRCWDTWGEYLRFFLYLFCKFFVNVIMVVLTLNVAQLVGGGYCCRSASRCRSIGYLEVIVHPYASIDQWKQTTANNSHGLGLSTFNHCSFYWHRLAP